MQTTYLTGFVSNMVGTRFISDFSTYGVYSIAIGEPPRLSLFLLRR